MRAVPEADHTLFFATKTAEFNGQATSVTKARVFPAGAVRLLITEGKPALSLALIEQMFAPQLLILLQNFRAGKVFHRLSLLRLCGPIMERTIIIDPVFSRPCSCCSWEHIE